MYGDIKIFGGCAQDRKDKPRAPTDTAPVAEKAARLPKLRPLSVAGRLGEASAAFTRTAR